MWLAKRETVQVNDPEGSAQDAFNFDRVVDLRFGSSRIDVLAVLRYCAVLSYRLQAPVLPPSIVPHTPYIG